MFHDRIVVRLRFHARRHNLARVRGLVDALVAGARDAAEFSREDREEIVLALQECLSNVARHAYPDAGASDDARARVDISLTLTPMRFRALIRDFGRPFDPAHERPPDPTRPRDGGNGLFLVRATMHRVRRRSMRGANYLELVRFARASQVCVVADASSTEPVVCA